jgi:iron complex outermembrane receptor protein
MSALVCLRFRPPTGAVTFLTCRNMPILDNNDIFLPKSYNILMPTPFARDNWIKLRRLAMLERRSFLTGQAICAVGLASMIVLGWVQEQSQAYRRGTDLTELSLEELMNIEVTTVARKEQKLSQAAAAVYVLTQEDIHRSGATSIAEALRMVPGLNVARIDANTWAISARGLNERFSNKLLVLIDGRSVYNPLFSGVYWDIQDTLLPDVDRIEVIRGPAGALWGANAVNGVINIITKSAKVTQGGLVVAGDGDEEKGFGAVRYGGKFGDNLYYRVYGKYFDRDDFVTPSGENAHDAWRVGRGGFRIDWDVADYDLLTFQGDYYSGRFGDRVVIPALAPPFEQTRIGDFPISGGNILGRWRRILSETSDLALQFYYDRTEREDAVHQELRDTVDIEFQHRFAFGRWQEVVWGLGYRFTTDDLRGSSFVSFDPISRGDHLFSAFIQNDLTLVDNRFRLTLGSKFEHNSYTGFEVQPNARLLWTPHRQHTIWAAISRAVRTPSRFEDSVRASLAVFPGLSPTCPAPLCEVVLVENRGFKSETLLAYELGYRVQPTPWFSVDLALFYNIYDDLRTVEPGTPFFQSSPPPARLILPQRADNRMDGQIYGVEVAAHWAVAERWKLALGYSWLQVQLHRDPSSRDVMAENAEGENPQHQVHLRSFLDLPYNLKFDTALYYVDKLTALNVPSYLRVDARLAWHPTRALEISIALQNLFDRRHLEFGPSLLVSPSEVERNVYGKILWRF